MNFDPPDPPANWTPPSAAIVEMAPAPEQSDVISDRGLRYAPPIAAGMTGDDAVQVYTSSMATGPHLWLATRQGERATTIHLTARAALRLAEDITRLVREHHLLREDLT